MNRRFVFLFIVLSLITYSCRTTTERENNYRIQTLVSENTALKEEIENLRVLLDDYKSTNNLLENEIENLTNLNTHYKSFVTGLGNNAIRAPFGRFILIKRKDVKVALKIIEHIMPRLNQLYNAPNFMGAQYVYYIWDSDNEKYSESSGKVFEPVEGVADNIYINFADFRIEWSLSDWLYFSDDITMMAVTECVYIDDVDFENPRIKWYSKKDLNNKSD